MWQVLEPAERVPANYYLSEEKTKKLLENIDLSKYETKKNEINIFGYIDPNGFRQVNEILNINGISTTLRTFRGGGLEPKIAIPCLLSDIEKLKPVGFSDGSGISYCVDANYSKGISISSIGKGRRTHIIQKPRGFNKGGILNLAPTLTKNAYEQNNILLTQSIINVLNIPQLGVTRGNVLGTMGISSCLTAGDSSTPKMVLVNGWAIRKLMPIECLRLQAFPDRVYYQAVDAGISNSQLYKQSGNSVTVNVVRAVAKLFR